MTGFSLFSCARLSDDSVAALLFLQDAFKNHSVEESIIFVSVLVRVSVPVPVLVDG